MAFEFTLIGRIVKCKKETSEKGNEYLSMLVADSMDTEAEPVGVICASQRIIKYIEEKGITSKEIIYLKGDIKGKKYKGKIAPPSFYVRSLRVVAWKKKDEDGSGGRVTPDDFTTLGDIDEEEIRAVMNGGGKTTGKSLAETLFEEFAS